MSCFGGKDEQIYLAELTVYRLKLTADKYREDFTDCPPLVKLKFIDFPIFVIRRRGEGKESTGDEDSCSTTTTMTATTTEPYNEEEGLLFACGKSCLFVYKPRDLVGKMQSQPLRLGIFRDEEETYPIAEATIPLSGCLCDQVAMVNNDEEHRPEPYTLEGNYNLLDPGKNPAGSIQIFFRLSFFGLYVISDYQLDEDGCIFNNDFDGKLRVTKVNEEDCEKAVIQTNF